MPNTREKLIKLVTDDYCPIIYMVGGVGILADYLIERGVTVQEWIPVTERLPALELDNYEESDGSRVQFEISGFKIVLTESGVWEKARYETGACFQGWVAEDGRTVEGVTHWMEPPVLP